MGTADGRKSSRQAVAEAFGTIEVFEAIILQLDLRDILRIQAVNRHFQKTITQSPLLQRRLFFKPVSDGEGQQPELNPLLAGLFPPLFTLNRPPCPTGLAKLCADFNLGWLSDPLRREKILRSCASWRRMFPVQPSAKLDAIKIISYDSCVRSKGSVTPARLGSYHQHLQDPGIRMGLLFDLIAQLEIMHPDPSFFVHWQMFPIGVRTDDWQQRAAAANNDDDDDEDNWEPDFYSWTKSNYYPLFLDQQQQQELSNTITLYHNHDSWCGMGSLPSSGLIQDTSFLLTINEVPKSMLEYLEDPETYAVNWTDYGMSIKDGKFEVNKAELGATVSHAFALFEAVE